MQVHWPALRKFDMIYLGSFFMHTTKGAKHGRSASVRR